MKVISHRAAVAPTKFPALMEHASGAIYLVIELNGGAPPMPGIPPLAYPRYRTVLLKKGDGAGPVGASADVQQLDSYRPFDGIVTLEN